MNSIRFPAVPGSIFAAPIAVLTCASPANAVRPVARDLGAVFAPLLRDAAAQARLSGETCVYARLWPSTDWTSYLSARSGWGTPGREPAGVTVRLSRRLDAALRAAAHDRSTLDTSFRIRRVPAPLGLIRGRQSGRCHLTEENPIGQISFSRPVFSGDLPFVEVQGLVWGTNPPPELEALQRTRRGWVVIAYRLAD